ncbi:MAG UNVERIFIED_CONTAM: SDR family NAD(P)-dependent oxidoreductase [Planctomycetaceae bacterium]|jgi:NAD(P)-dependent dehydrogenase (short-subunit alcohol dehydrogenase family)
MKSREQRSGEVEIFLNTGSGDILMLNQPASPVAVVTGAGRRLGREFAFAMARRRYAVLVHHRSSTETAGELVHELREMGVSAAVVQADFRTPATAANIVFSAAAELGKSEYSSTVRLYFRIVRWQKSMNTTAANICPSICSHPCS